MLTLKRKLFVKYLARKNRPKWQPNRMQTKGACKKTRREHAHKILLPSWNLFIEENLGIIKFQCSIVGTYMESFAFYYGLEFVVTLNGLMLGSFAYSSMLETDKSEIGVKIYLKKKTHHTKQQQQQKNITTK